jgi:hypothetical protein
MSSLPLYNLPSLVLSGETHPVNGGVQGEENRRGRKRGELQAAARLGRRLDPSVREEDRHLP